MPINDGDVWMKNPDAIGYYKSVPFESTLGERVLNDLAIRYPHFKPKYIRQDRMFDGAPNDIVAVYANDPEDVFVTIVTKDSPRPEGHYNDIAGAIYILSGEMLTFEKAFTYYDLATSQPPQIRPELRDFYNFYQQLYHSAPAVAAMIETFALSYEKQIAEYNGVYEPLALRELLWKFGDVLLGS